MRLWARYGRNVLLRQPPYLPHTATFTVSMGKLPWLLLKSKYRACGSLQRYSVLFDNTYFRGYLIKRHLASGVLNLSRYFPFSPLLSKNFGKTLFNVLFSCVLLPDMLYYRYKEGKSEKGLPLKFKANALH